MRKLRKSQFSSSKGQFIGCLEKAVQFYEEKKVVFFLLLFDRGIVIGHWEAFWYWKVDVSLMV